MLMIINVILRLSLEIKIGNEEVEANEYRSKEYIEGFFNCGYAEPTSELLDMWGIEHEIMDIEDVECDEDGNIICDEIIGW